MNLADSNIILESKPRTNFRGQKRYDRNNRHASPAPNAVSYRKILVEEFDPGNPTNLDRLKKLDRLNQEHELRFGKRNKSVAHTQLVKEIQSIF